MRLSLVLALASLVACAPSSSPSSSGGGNPAPATAFSKHVSFAIDAEYGAGDSLEVVARDFARIRELGVRTWRGPIAWDDHEPERGRYDLAWLHAFAERARADGITLRPYVTYTPAWETIVGLGDGRASDDPPRDLGAWEQFVDTLVRGMSRHDNIASWELYNGRQVMPGWDGTPEEYDSTLASGMRAARRADPRAVVFPGGPASADAGWMAHACAAARPHGGIAVAAVHAYPETWAADSVTVEGWLDAGFRDNYLARMSEACGPVPVWINEAGFATGKGATEHDQAAWWVRAVGSWLALPRVEHIGIGQLRDATPGRRAIGDAASPHRGLLTADGRPRLAFSTVRMLVSLFDTGRLTVADGELVAQPRDSAGARTYQHLFVRPDGRQVLVAWSVGGTASMAYLIPRGGRAARAYALDGTDMPWSSFDGRTLDDVALVPGTPRVFVIDP